MFKNIFSKKNHIFKEAKAYVGLEINHVLEGEMGLNHVLEGARLELLPWNNHVLRGAKVPFPKGHDCSKKRHKLLIGMTSTPSPWRHNCFWEKKRFKLLLLGDMIVPHGKKTTSPKNNEFSLRKGTNSLGNICFEFFSNHNHLMFIFI